MAIDHQILCITRTTHTDPHERIQKIGGLNSDGKRWGLTLDDAIEGIELDKWRFWTAGGGASVWVEIAKHNGRKYLKTVADGLHPDNLLALPDCP
jgi:hypothetical protein